MRTRCMSSGLLALCLLFAACSGQHSEALSCSDISQCPVEQACNSNWSCEDPATAVVRARATAVGAPAIVTVTPREGACDPGLEGACEVRALSDVVFSAPTLEGFRFARWQAADGAAASSIDLCVGEQPELVIASLRGNVYCAATYVVRTKVSAVAAADGGLIVATSDAPFARCADATCEVDQGSIVKLSVSPRGRFVGWTGKGCESLTV